jgi:CubicO group peptidase (beta-lactamase class C family)
MFVRGDKVIGFEAHGFADRDGKRAVDRDTIFHWASCTKTFTGIAVMQLRDRGKLKLDEPILDFVPELRAAHDPLGQLKKITLQHLMTHSAGFRSPTWPWGGDKPWHPHEPTAWSQLVAMMPYTEIEFEAGSKFSYSNPGIVFLGRAIEQLSGDDYEVYMEKNVLRPLGMKRSYFDITPYHLQRFRSHSYEVAKAGAPRTSAPTSTRASRSATAVSTRRSATWRSISRSCSRPWRRAATPPTCSRASRSKRCGSPCCRPRRRRRNTSDCASSYRSAGGTRFVSHTGGQRAFVTFFYVHPASGTGALGAFNTSTAGPVMSQLRTLCMETLSLAMKP